jgi:Fur family ferric uptake transcriptional regulator
MHRLETIRHEHGLRLTEHRRVMLDVLEASTDHPSVHEIHRRAARGHRFGLATVYRTLKTFVEAGAVARRDFGDGRARYESVRDQRHDHLVDIKSGAIVEFDEVALGFLVKAVAQRLGYRLVDYRLELFAERGSADS